MRAAISLLVLLLSMCGVQTESHGTDASTQDVSTELKELRDLVVDLRATLAQKMDSAAHEQELAALKTRLAASETAVDDLKKENVVQQRELTALERALQDTKAEMKTEVDNLKTENAAQEAELTAVKTRLAATETEMENLENEIRAAPKVAFSAGLRESGNIFIKAGSTDLNVVFKRVITNVGEAYNSTTGFFTAPVRGVYYFRFTVMDELASREMGIWMNKNGRHLMAMVEYDTDGQPSYLSSGLALQLEKGDTVNLQLPADYRLYDHSYNRCTFSGFLLFPL